MVKLIIADVSQCFPYNLQQFPNVMQRYYLKAKCLIQLENTFACRTLGNYCGLYRKHWETSAMINSTKELPQKTTVIQSERKEQYS